MGRKVAVTYYGMIAEKIGKTHEDLELPSGNIELRSFFEQKYPNLTKQTFSIAVDLNYTATISADASPHKIDIMPPFAGG
jgi:molybdopterin converting factor small subunit